MSFFNAALNIVLAFEGGYVADPADPGGVTKFGISQRAYPTLDIANLTLEDASVIYQRDYWEPLGLDGKPWSTALMKFDCAVNQGPTFAKSLPDDATDIAVARALKYSRSSDIALYGRGWFNRLFAVYKASQVTPSG